MIGIPAHAKLNLCLGVAPPEGPGSLRAGWHRIASWMACIELADEVRLHALRPRTRSEYAVTWATDISPTAPIDWPIEKDLAIRAHRALEAHIGRELPVRLEVRKRVPVGGGLGGGSSDAAAALLGLNELFELGLPVTDLAAIGAGLGSDVAFFLDRERNHGTARPALVTGFGDRIERLEPVAAPVLLVIPPFPCSTPAVYRAYDRLGAQGRGDDAAPVRAAASGRLVDADVLFNDLRAAACEVEPRLQRILTKVSEATGLPTHVTGSGSCLFVIGADASAVALTEQALARSEPHGTRVLTTRLI